MQSTTSNSSEASDRDSISYCLPPSPPFRCLSSEIDESTPRSPSPVLTRAAITQNFYEEKLLELRKKKKGWSPKAIWAKIEYKWYAFGMKLNKDTQARPARYADRERRRFTRKKAAEEAKKEREFYLDWH
ncbi:hypothetical protein Slin15195_G090040 [Septoria linicola]|uniref:Uncharacterized protein n=1 Tax=Septoria linicola TaxID=215465 RepID=A0A9Q9AV49_9PEZI|nr:hypothetical protein Slin14017_G125650 [Septoria linicola]USW55685.1 hypothetical protein Slin15195_G090040 [Septoria linicola]